MKKIEFPIYLKGKNYNSHIVLLIIFFFIFIGFFFNNFLLTLYLHILFFVSLFFIVPHFSKQYLWGELKGKVCLTKDIIIINNNSYKLSDIETIRICAFDYENKNLCKRRNSNSINIIKNECIWTSTIFFRCSSQGVSNAIILKLNNNKYISAFFKLKKGEFQKASNLLVHYHKLGKISFLNLIAMLQIEKEIDSPFDKDNNYENIQLFKKKYNIDTTENSKTKLNHQEFKWNNYDFDSKPY